MERLSPSSTTTEPVLQSPGAATTERRSLEPVLHKKRSHCKEKLVQRNERVAPAGHNPIEKFEQQQRPSTPRNK